MNVLTFPQPSCLLLLVITADEPKWPTAQTHIHTPQHTQKQTKDKWVWPAAKTPPDQSVGNFHGYMKTEPPAHGISSLEYNCAQQKKNCHLVSFSSNNGAVNKCSLFIPLNRQKGQKGSGITGKECTSANQKLQNGIECFSHVESMHVSLCS